ncbi:MAG TPA: cytochrome c [Actinomycetota bacterium]|jgi:ubiquinol-cytochrome c reductase cytochrome c subunit|nr:cytochrome c [Actinomycetota bacterium]
MRSVLALAAAVVIAAAIPAQAQPSLEEGRELFEVHCASCHGPAGVGTRFGPPLVGVGEAAADFQLRTGRMPLAQPDAPTLRKPPAFDERQIELLVAYIGSLDGGPEIPELDLVGADLQLGARLFLDNCAACHGATANGGAAGGSAFAPSLDQSLPLDIAEAMITAPGEMPKFAFSDDERDAVVRYVMYLQEQPSPGGLDIGGIGPVSEGFVAWALAMVILVLIVALVATGPGRSKERVLGDEDA